MYNPTKPYKAKILKLIESTWKTPYIKVMRGLYPTFELKFNYPQIDHTDGIGTKGYYHWAKGTFREAVIDAMAMNLNDLAVVGAIPFKMTNHITVPVEDVRIVKIVQAMVKECQKRKIAIVGGENSYHKNSEGMDISMTISGIIKKPKTNQFQIGDVLIGLKSSGIHSNGITTIRKVFGKRIRHEFTIPTIIYLDKILKLDKKYDIHGMTHITGGAYTKLKEISPGLDINIFRHKAKPQDIFNEIYEQGIKDNLMYETFNCGIGYIFSVPRKQAENARKTSGGVIIGAVVKGNGNVNIESQFSLKTVRF